MNDNIPIKKVLKENEIELIRRTKDNYTHEVIQDMYIKEITTWKTSEKKLGNYYLYNILSLGIVHILSKHKPLLFLKLNCIPCIPKEAEYFLVKDIYGECQLCIKESKRNTQSHSSGINIDDISNENILGITTNNIGNLSNQIIGFNYNSKFYEYNESLNKIIPIFFDLTKLSNRKIYQLFIDGLSTQNKVNKLKERYGLNICPFNLRLFIIYFLKAEFVILIFSIIFGAIEAAFGNKIQFLFIFLTIVITIIYQYYLIKRTTLKREYTLEGEKKQLKVKRKYMSEENNDYCYINNIDLLPGDLIYLKKDENVPCDGIILEGECIIDLSDVNGSMAEFRKKELDNNTNQFNYRANKNSILYHGSKILKSFSKLENNSILLLCINTGTNTYKANQLLNVLYIFKKNKNYSEIYSYFCGKKNVLLIHCICIFIVSTIGIIILYFFIEANKEFKKIFNKDLFVLILTIISKCFIPSFHVISSGIIVNSIRHLLTVNVFCYDKSRLLYAGNINTIFFDKTGTLTEKSLELVGFLPAISSSNTSEICLKFYNINQIKDLTSILINYYTNNIDEDSIFNDNISYSNIYDKDKRASENQKKMAVSYLECLISCNDLEKINNQIYGNSIEKEIFSQSKWEMKINSDESKYQIKKNVFFEEDKSNTNNESFRSLKTINETYDVNEKFSEYKVKILDEKIDLYPNNYYKITEGKKIFIHKNSNNFDNMNSSKDLIVGSNTSKLNDNLYDNSEKENIKKYSKGNQIIDDIIQNENNINSYKLRVYKRFIKKGTLYSSAIVYNPLMKTLHFMTKGPPEKIIPYCNYNYLPKNLNKIISSYRKNGYISLVLGSKIISEYNYDKNMGEDFYMSNLNFCGLIVLKNKLKKGVKEVVEQLKNLKCDLILNTGDNIYNSLSASYESGLISSKNIFVFDYNKMTKKITVTDFNDIFKNIPIKLNSSFNYDKIFSSNNYKKKLTNSRIFTNRKNNMLANKLEKMNSIINKKENNKNSASKTNLPNPNFTEKIKKIKGKDNIPQLKLGQTDNNIINNAYSNSNTNNNKLKTFNKIEINSNLEMQTQSINSRNEFLDKSISINDNQMDTTSNNLNLITTSNNSNNLNIQNIFPTIKRGKSTNKIRASAILSSLNKGILNQPEEKPPNKKQLESSLLSLKRKETKNTSFINTDTNRNKINNDYNPSKLKLMRNDCVYCVSGPALRFIYEKRFVPEFKKYEFPILLNHIKKYGKIFYKMKSKDKSFLIDFYRKMPGKITCMVGDSQNDIDAIMTSHVGINISSPVNLNTVLCHFRPFENNLYCIEKIIRCGRVTFENIYLLAVSSVLYLVILIMYIYLLCIYNIGLSKTEADFLSSNFFFLCILAYTVKPDKNIENSPLFHDTSLYKKFYMIISVCNLLFNIGILFLFLVNYSNNEELEIKEQKEIFSTYCYFLSYFQMVGMIFSINSINYYRISDKHNYCFCIVIILIISALSFIYLICEYSFYPLSKSVLAFELSSKNIDTFDDKNKLASFATYLIYMASFYICVLSFFTIFNRIAIKKVNKNKNL